jgi:hypothetical protein
MKKVIDFLVGLCYYVGMLNKPHKSKQRNSKPGRSHQIGVFLRAVGIPLLPLVSIGTAHAKI